MYIIVIAGIFPRNYVYEPLALIIHCIIRWEKYGAFPPGVNTAAVTALHPGEVRECRTCSWLVRMRMYLIRV